MAAAPGSAGDRPATAYRALVERHGEELRRAERVAVRIGTARVLVFLGAGACLVLADLLEGGAARTLIVWAALLILLFAALVVRHRKVRERARRYAVLRSLAAEGLLRLARDWDTLAAVLPAAERAEEPLPERHPYADDLHLEGRASLARLAGPVTSLAGRHTLRGWLLAHAHPRVLRLRHGAVAELAGAIDFRMELAWLGRRTESEDPEEPDALIAWAAQPSAVLGDSSSRWATGVLPPVTIVLAALQAAGVVPALWLLPFAVQIVVLRRVTRRLEGSFAEVARGASAVRAYGPQLRLVEAMPWRSDLLVDIGRRLDVSDEPAHARLDRLGRLGDIVESRRNVFYKALNLVLLLDVHLGVALERWRERSGSHVERWLEALGEVEALSALGCLAHDHPDWTFPEGLDRPAPEGAVLRARALGHPLLAPGECVRNDVEVGPPGTFLLVTGSNMSGKSTLLRAIGANTVLAGAGGPVCAERMELPELRLHTSMRVTDSLEEGVSHFMAELLRVRDIVQAARERSGDERPVLYLLDELLQGTNTAERKVAARAILRHLLDAGAIGAVTTHDLTLHEASDLEDRARAWHFREAVEEGAEGTLLHFDYRLRPGLATTRNALRLLEAVGLGSAEQGEEPTR